MLHSTRQAWAHFTADYCGRVLLGAALGPNLESNQEGLLGDTSEFIGGGMKKGGDAE
jgi:hypothetical protein